MNESLRVQNESLKRRVGELEAEVCPCRNYFTFCYITVHLWCENNYYSCSFISLFFIVCITFNLYKLTENVLFSIKNMHEVSHWVKHTEILRTLWHILKQERLLLESVLITGVFSIAFQIQFCKLNSVFNAWGTSFIIISLIKYPRAQTHRLFKTSPACIVT